MTPIKRKPVPAETGSADTSDRGQALDTEECSGSLRLAQGSMKRPAGPGDTQRVSHGEDPYKGIGCDFCTVPPAAQDARLVSYILDSSLRLVACAYEVRP